MLGEDRQPLPQDGIGCEQQHSTTCFVMEVQHGGNRSKTGLSRVHVQTRRTPLAVLSSQHFFSQQHDGVERTLFQQRQQVLAPLRLLPAVL